MSSSMVRKICVVCGENVANKPRTKDQAGRYYCDPCWQAAVAPSSISATQGDLETLAQANRTIRKRNASTQRSSEWSDQKIILSIVIPAVAVILLVVIGIVVRNKIADNHIAELRHQKQQADALLANRDYRNAATAYGLFLRDADDKPELSDEVQAAKVSSRKAADEVAKADAIERDRQRVERQAAEANARREADAAEAKRHVADVERLQVEQAVELWMTIATADQECENRHSLTRSAKSLLETQAEVASVLGFENARAKADFDKAMADWHKANDEELAANSRSLALLKKLNELDASIRNKAFSQLLSDSDVPAKIKITLRRYED